MTKRMLIDAAHAEETRVVVVDGTHVEEFDFESQSKKQLRGNIYLAKVTRVEPSLQAAFVEYGGNRHGFLAFNEIHPDYYHIPLADKEALLREEAEEEEAHAKSGRSTPARSTEGGEGEDDDSVDAADDDDDDVMEEEAERRRRRLMRRYKIQEVIKRRQIMLVQVVKEERGNKGAALTTYLSLAGRYCVLMPNTARGGGISRKITTVTDRRRLKTLVQSLDVPQGMGLIVRTAGAKRTKAEIKRDYEYLERLWENIREVTMNSIAPALIYEEEDLVKRAIRDMYDKDLDGIIVEGEEGYRSAKEFMRMLMPSQAKKIQAYREPTPLFIKARVEDHLAQIYTPTVPLRSGGYLVINQTEALVAIDVNSGRATRERNVEATALKTNCEAAEEAARQLRLRDLAGLVVIDFIDMDEAKNNRTVEKVLKDALKDDRARIQMGKISSFGLMELSRQRRRSGVLEGTTHVCEHCQGTGRVRATESSALSALRAVEMEAVRQGPGEIVVKAPPHVALYILNNKRAYLLRLLQTRGLQVTVIVDETLSHADHLIERISTLSEEESAAFAASIPAVTPTYADLPDDDDDFDEEEEEEDEEAIAREDDDDDEPRVALDRSAHPAEGRDGDGESRRGRGRRRRRGGRREEGSDEPRPAAATDAEDNAEQASRDDDGDGRRRRRRGRRGGRRMREEARPQDVYAWSRVRVPHTDGVYGWFDPSAPSPMTTPPPALHADPAPQVSAERPVYDFVEASTVQPAAPSFDGDIWVELPEAAEPPAKTGRPRRSRSRKPATTVDAPAEAPSPVEAVPAAPEPVALEPVAPEPVAAAAPEQASPIDEAPAKAPRKRRAPAKAKAAAAEAFPDDAVGIAPEPAPVLQVVEAPPAPAAAPEPDPAEISTPPAEPKRGWWRR